MNVAKIKLKHAKDIDGVMNYCKGYSMSGLFYLGGDAIVGFKINQWIDKKMAGMILLCSVIAKDLEVKAKLSAKFIDRTGHARQGITGDSTGGGSNYNINLSYGVDYGEILEEGSKPHVIEGNPYLYWKGASHPVKRVNHPGTKGFHTLENTLQENKGTVINAVKDYWGS